MTLAYMLIKTEMGKGPEIQIGLRAISEITEINEVYGVYDIITRVQAENMEDFKEIISTKIRDLKHIRSTLTLIVVE